MYRVGAILLTILFLAGCSNNASVKSTGEAESKKSAASEPKLTPEQAQMAAEDELMALEMAFNKARQKLIEKVRAAPADEQMKIYMNESEDKKFAVKHLELAKKYPDTDSEFRAIQFAMANGDEGTIDDAIDILNRKFLNDDRLSEMLESFGMVASPPRQKHEDFLKGVIKNSTNRNVKGGASFALAKLYSGIEELKGMFEGDGDLDPATKEMMSFVLKDRGEGFSAELEKMYDTVSQEYGDVPFGRKTIGELAEGELFAFKHLSMGKVAPDIDGVDLDGKAFKLSEYRGKVVMLDFWGDW